MLLGLATHYHSSWCQLENCTLQCTQCGCKAVCWVLLLKWPRLWLSISYRRIDPLSVGHIRKYFHACKNPLCKWYFQSYTVNTKPCIFCCYTFVGLLSCFNCRFFYYDWWKRLSIPCRVANKLCYGLSNPQRSSVAFLPICSHGKWRDKIPKVDGPVVQFCHLDSIASTPTVFTWHLSLIPKWFTESERFKIASKGHNTFTELVYCELHKCILHVLIWCLTYVYCMGTFYVPGVYFSLECH